MRCNAPPRRKNQLDAKDSSVRSRFLVDEQSNDDVEKRCELDRPTTAVMYRRYLLGEVVYWFLSIATFGLFALWMSWFPIRLFKMTSMESSVETSDRFLLNVKDSRGRVKQRIVPMQNVLLDSDARHLAVLFKNGPPSDYQASPQYPRFIFFEFNHVRHFLNYRTRVFERLSFHSSRAPGQSSARPIGLSDETVIADRRKVYGECTTSLDPTPIFQLLVKEIIHPLYVFQMLGVAFWIYDGYYQYAVCVLIISVASLAFQLHETRQTEIRIHALSQNRCSVKLFKKNGLDSHPDRQYETGMSSFTSADRENRVSADKVWHAESESLVPGHVIEVQVDMTLPCDALLLCGTAVVDESVLTGESIPVRKCALDTERQGMRDPATVELRGNHTSALFAGSKVVAVKRTDVDNPRVLALVVRTGFSTMQGCMMRSVLSPAKTRFSFNRESCKFLLTLFFLALVGGGFSFVMASRLNVPMRERITRIIDLIFVLVPPVLPSAVSTATSIASARLFRRHRISCISPTRINVSGQVNTLVFDKTGTLTEPRIHFDGIVPVIKKDEETAGKISTDTYTDVSCVPSLVQQAMATCHSLAIVNGEVVGDPLEILMAKNSGWAIFDGDSLPETDKCFDWTSAAAPGSAVTDSTKCSTDNDGEAVPLLSRQGTHEPSSGGPTRTFGTLSEHIEAKKELAMASKPQICAALLNVYNCGTSVPMIARPQSSAGYLTRALTHGMTLAELAGDCAETDNEGEGGNVHRGDSYPLSTGEVDELGIVKRFDFEASLQRMSVVTQNPADKRLVVFSKGAPEKLLELSCQSSVPPNTRAVLDHYTQRGARVFAIAFRELGTLSSKEVELMQRKDIEKDLTFLGFLVFANHLKSDTKESISRLRDAGCLCLMATGDNSLTAVAISRRSGLLPSGKHRRIILGDLVGDQVIWTQHEGREGRGNGETVSSARLVDLLRGEDYREFQYALTGRAFRTLRQKHAENGAEWSAPPSDRHLKEENRRLPLKDGLADLETGCGDNDVMSFHIGHEMMSVLADVTPGWAAMCQTARTDRHSDIRAAFRLQMVQAVPYVATMPVFEFILRNAVVYSRMTPDDKAALVTSLKSLPTQPLVGMCGDGANDCAALRTADMGVSLSDNEASIAAPFTCAHQSVGGVVELLREGRAALVNSFQLFKFILLYSFIEFSAATTLHCFGLGLSNTQFIWIDLFTVLPLSILMSWTLASDTLTARLPTGSLMTTPILASLIGQICIQSLILVMSTAILVFQPFYVAYEPDEFTGTQKGAEYKSAVNTAVFLLGNLQYPLVCFVITMSHRPWRKGTWTNIPMSFCLLTLFTIGIALLFADENVWFMSHFVQWLNLGHLDRYFRVMLFCIWLFDFLLSWAFENYFISDLALRHDANAWKSHCVSAYPLPHDRSFRIVTL